jgi:hypothetical protein
MANADPIINNGQNLILEFYAPTRLIQQCVFCFYHLIVFFVVVVVMNLCSSMLGQALSEFCRLCIFYVYCYGYVDLNLYELELYYHQIDALQTFGSFETISLISSYSTHRNDELRRMNDAQSKVAFLPTISTSPTSSGYQQPYQSLLNQPGLNQTGTKQQIMPSQRQQQGLQFQPQPPNIGQSQQQPNSTQLLTQQSFIILLSWRRCLWFGLYKCCVFHINDKTRQNSLNCSKNPGNVCGCGVNGLYIVSVAIDCL